jgi:hypothetical protein
VLKKKDSLAMISIVLLFLFPTFGAIAQSNSANAPRLFKRYDPAAHYLIRPMRWSDEVSTYPPDSEPEFPSVFVIEVTNGKNRAGR